MNDCFRLAGRCTIQRYNKLYIWDGFGPVRGIGGSNEMDTVLVGFITVQKMSRVIVD